MTQRRLYIAFALAYFFAPAFSQELFVSPPEVSADSPATNGDNTNSTMPEDGGVLSLLVQIFGGVVQGMLDSQGITSDHVNNALNIFSPEKVHDDLILFRKTLNLGLRFVTFLMRFLPRMSVDGAFNPLEYFKSKIAFYNTRPVSENGPFIAFNKIEPVLRPDVPERIQKVVDFATEETETNEVGASTTATLTDDDIRMLVPSGKDAQTTTVVSITQYVNQQRPSTASAERATKATSITEESTYPTPTRPSFTGTSKPLPLIRQPATLANLFNIKDLDVDDLGSDFGQIRRSRIVKKEVPPRAYRRRVL